MPASMTEVHDRGGHTHHPKRTCPACLADTSSECRVTLGVSGHRDERVAYITGVRAAWGLVADHIRQEKVDGINRFGYVERPYHLPRGEDADGRYAKVIDSDPDTNSTLTEIG